MNQSVFAKRVRVSDILITIAIYMAAGISMLLLLGIVFYTFAKYSLQGTTQGRYLTGGVPPIRFSM